ncbi:DUF1223 domain-containing protein [Crenobacter oryzisoli]|nr:DUF1223 domain-containing protein [Crenobacter sp. SG2303]
MMRYFPLLALAVLPLAGQTAALSAHSPTPPALLVELYSSEGCNSCPPADAWLGMLGRYGPRVIPLALHVPYWDGLGWRDRFAQPAFEARQRQLAAANGRGFVYTPGVFANGREFADWHRDSALRERLANVGTNAPQLRLEASVDVGTIAATLAADSLRPGEQLRLALAQDGLVSRVQAGENAGVTLHHQHVVRAWQGPWTTQQAHARFQLPADGGALTLVGWVERAANGQVLNAVALPLPH